MNNPESNRQWYGLDENGDIVPVELSEPEPPKTLDADDESKIELGDTAKDLLG